MREWNAATSPTAQKVVESETKIKIVNVKWGNGYNNNTNTRRKI